MEKFENRVGVRRKFQKDANNENSKMCWRPQKIKIGKKEFGP
jgi:hypothetical protein